MDMALAFIVIVAIGCIAFAVFPEKGAITQLEEMWEKQTKKDS